MTTLLILIALLIALPLLYLATLDGNFLVTRSLKIGVEPKTVFETVGDFRRWQSWSPWLMHEPETRLEFSDDPDQEGGWYSWDGKTVGAGRVIHESFSSIQRLDQRIEFTRPFKSVSKIWWEFEPFGNGETLVHWNMGGKMPFLLRFLAKRIPEFVGKDYDTGLRLLRGVLEPDAETLKLTVDGNADLPEQSALAIHFEGDLEALKATMMDSFTRLSNHVDEQHLTPTGNPFTIYHKVDIKRMHFNCDMAIPVPAETKSNAFEIKTYPGGRYYKTTLQGSYEFLELAWYQAYSHLKMQKIKPDGKRPSLEVYENDPNTVKHSNEILTSIYIPIK